MKYTFVAVLNLASTIKINDIRYTNKIFNQIPFLIIFVCLLFAYFVE